MILFGGSLYAVQTFLNASAADSRLETQLYQDAQRFGASYKRSILSGQSPAAQHETLSSGEIVLLLRWGIIRVQDDDPVSQRSTFPTFLIASIA